MWDDDEYQPSDPPPIEVENTPNPIVSVLLGPDGEVVSRLYERPRIAFGFSPAKEASRIERC